MVAGLAFLLSVLTDAPLGAVGGAVLLRILSSILDQITALGAMRDFLPTHYSDAWLGLLSTPMQTDDVVKGAISAICYATLVLGAGLLALHPQGRHQRPVAAGGSPRAPTASQVFDHGVSRSCGILSRRMPQIGPTD